MAFEMIERDEKYIDFQKLVDEGEMKSVKNTLIRNYINSVPSRFNNLVKLAPAFAEIAIPKRV